MCLKVKTNRGSIIEDGTAYYKDHNGKKPLGFIVSLSF